MNIIQFPNEALLHKAQPLAAERDCLLDRDLAIDVARRLEHELQGIPMGYAGLAAPQIGLSLRMFAFSPSRGIRVFANPGWTPVHGPDSQGEQKEGCFSVERARIVVPVIRYKKIIAWGIEILRWDDSRRVKTKAFLGHLLGWEARVWQHEHDHLEGILLGGCQFKKNEHPPSE